MVNETKPLAKVNAVQAQTQIPQDELLDVGVHEFDVNITAELANDTDELAKKRIYPDIRKAEARYIPRSCARRSNPPGSGAPCAWCRRTSSSST